MSEYSQPNLVTIRVIIDWLDIYNIFIHFLVFESENSKKK
jgi:hypothetical protein